MDELIVGKMYYISESSIEDAEFKRFMKIKGCLCKCTSKRGKFKIRDGVYRYMKYWVAEKEAKMGKCNVSDVELSDFLENLERNYPPKWYIRVIAQDLRDARKELEEAKNDSVWRDAPETATSASVLFCNKDTGYIANANRVYYRNIPKTPKQELIDKFAEKNALAMKCANLSKEILEAFVKEYEGVMKPLDK